MKPKHYADGDLEPLKIIQQHNLPFELGNVIKYIARCNHKGTKREDLEKAIDYLRRYCDYADERLPDRSQLMSEWGISDDLADAVIFILETNAVWAKMAIEMAIQRELNNE